MAKENSAIERTRSGLESLGLQSRLWVGHSFLFLSVSRPSKAKGDLTRLLEGQRKNNVKGSETSQSH